LPNNSSERSTSFDDDPLKMVKMQGGVFGAVSTSEALVAAIWKASGARPSDKVGQDRLIEKLLT
jgi:hypothetical protein